MSLAPRQTTLPSHVRSNSAFGGAAAGAQVSALQARINEKRLELESLKQLRDLSAGLAEQMQSLEAKLATLSNGTEAIAAVMEKWQTVLQAINIASAHIASAANPNASTSETQLPQVLVRIPIHEAEAAQAQKEAAKHTGDSAE